MPYPVKNASYAGEEIAKSRCHADGGRIDPSARGAKMLKNINRVDGYLKKAGVPSTQSQDMQQAVQVSDAVPRRKE